MPRILLLYTVLVFCILNPKDSFAVCTREQAIKADEATDTLKSWEAVHDFFKKYAECDDGGIAEGIDDGVAKLLANDWAHIAVLQKLTDADQDFGEFVLRHISMTADSSDIARANKLARNECPPNAKRICKDVKAETDELNREFKIFYKVRKLTQQEVSAYTRKAESGDKNSAYMLYKYYDYDGKAEKGIEFLTFAANKNHTAAQIDLAYHFLREKQFDKAEEWALKAKKNGCKNGTDTECSTGLLLRRIRKIKKEARQ